VDRLKENNIDRSELFKYIEIIKSRTLLDQIGTDSSEIHDEESKKKALEMEKHFLEFVPSDSEDLLRSEMRLVSRLPIASLWDYATKRGLLDCIEDIHAINKSGFQKVEKIASLSQIMNNLQFDEIIIEYFIPFHELHPSYELWILVITSEKVHIIPAITEHFEGSDFVIGRFYVDGRQPIDRSPLGNLVLELRMAIRNEEEKRAEDFLKRLYNLLILPVRNLGIKLQDFHRIVIVPHGVLHYVPFAALLSPEGRYLIEEIALNVVPSASVWYRLQEFQRPDVKNFLGFFNPTLTYTNLPSLKSSEKELERILKYLNGINITVCKQYEATEESFRTYIDNKNIVHLASHGYFPEENAIDFHQILLCPSDKHDGRLYAEELRQMKLDSIRLFVLSICDSCLYRFGPGDEPYGLIAALLSKGTENILGTLWPIEDEIGVYFIDQFYKNLLTLGPAEAIRRASIFLIKDQALLRHWAGYVLVGVGRPFF
jgi:CHAT domain-containing protein